MELQSQQDPIQITRKMVKDIFPVQLKESLNKWKSVIIAKAFSVNFLKGGDYTWTELGAEFERLAEYRFLFTIRSSSVEDVRDYILYKLVKNPVITIKTLREDYIIDIEPEAREAYIGKMFKRLLERMARLDIIKFHWEDFTELFPTRFWAASWATPEDYLFAIKPYKDHDMALIKRKDLKAAKKQTRSKKDIEFQCKECQQTFHSVEEGNYEYCRICYQKLVAEKS